MNIVETISEDVIKVSIKEPTPVELAIEVNSSIAALARDGFTPVSWLVWENNDSYSVTLFSRTESSETTGVRLVDHKTRPDLVLSLRAESLRLRRLLNQDAGTDWF